MIKCSKVAALVISLIFLILLSGCGKLGEEQVDKMLKNKYKNNLVSSTYTVDEKNKLGQAQITVKNSSGKEIKTTIYYYVAKNQDKVVVRVINTVGVPKKLVTELAANHPENFRNYIYLYQELDAMHEECENACDEYESKYFTVFEKGSNFEIWFLDEGIEASKSVNNKIEEYEDRYNSAPSVIQRDLSIPPDYFSLSYDEYHYYAKRTSSKP